MKSSLGSIDRVSAAAEGSSAPSGGRSSLVIRAMPIVFVMIWSTGFVVARFGMPHAPPFKFLAIRFALSLLCFGIWIGLRVGLAGFRSPAERARWWPGTRAQYLHLAVVGVLIQAGYLGGVWSAVKAGLGAGTVALLVGLQPVLTAVWLTAVAARKTPLAGSVAAIGPRQWLGLTLGLGGLVLVVWHKLEGGEVTPANLAMAGVGLASITAGTLYQKRYVAPCDVRTALAIQLLAAFVVTLPLALLEAEPLVWHPQLIGALAWSVLALTLGGNSLLFVLLQRGAATAVTSLMYLVPPCTALLAWLVFREAFTWSMAVGMLLTVAGVMLVVRPPVTRIA